MPNNGLRDFNRRMAAIPKAVRAAVKPALDAAADELVTAQRRLAPVDDGTLRDSIKWHESGELTRTVFAGGETTTRTVENPKGAHAYEYDYAIGVEFGTRKTPAQPFFWPAYRLVRKRVNGRIKRATSKAVQQYGGR